MTDLDVALRSLADDLAAEPLLPAAEVRRRGSRRRARRHLLLGAAATAAVAAVAVGFGFHGRPDASPPATSSTTRSDDVPVGFVLVARSPKVFANAAGGSGLSGVDVTAAAHVVVDGGCLVITSAGSSAPAEGSPEAMPRVLVLPVATTWLGQSPPVDPDAGAARLPDERLLPIGSRITSGFSLSQRDDMSFSRACPGTAGYAVIAEPGDVVAIGPDDAVPGRPTSSATTSSSSRASSPRDRWITTIDDFPLATGLTPTGDESLTESTRSIDLTGLVPCLATDSPATDAVMSKLVRPAGQIVRQLRTFPDDHAAAEAFDAWMEKARACSGFSPAVDSPPSLVHDFQVERFGPDEAFVAQIVRDKDTGGLYPWGGHLAVKRVGNALLTITETNEAQATPDNIARWKAGDRETLNRLGRSMCRFAPGGVCG